MNIMIAAVSAPLEMNGVSRHAANLAHALLECDSVSSLHFVAGDEVKSGDGIVLEKRMSQICRVARHAIHLQRS